MPTQTEANRQRLCLICGEPDAVLLRTKDGRNVRACIPCLNGTGCDWSTATEREPLPCEVQS